VLVHDFAHVGRPAREVAESITVDADGWLRRLAAAAWTDERKVITRVGPGDPLIKRPVVVTVGPVRNGPGGTISVPIRWQDESHPGAFPTLDADLIVTALPEDRARLEILARYDPPFGRAGRVIDDALLHGLAESTIRSFLTQAATVLQQAAVDPEQGSEP
jgi:hypothetical protein